MTADAERQVDLLRLEPGDLLAEQLERRVVVGARRAEQLVVALVAAEDRVGQVEEHDRRLGEVGEPLVLEPAPGHQVAGRGGIDDVVGVDGALRRDVVDDGLVGERLVADARPAVPRRALPEALGGGVGVGLGRLEPVLVAAHAGTRAAVGQSAWMSLRLNASVAGHSAFEPKPSASRWYGVSRSDGAVAGEDGQDRHGLAELAQAGDEAAARERDVVRVRRDEDVGHGRPSIPSARPAPAARPSLSPSKPPAPMSGTKTQ